MADFRIIEPELDPVEFDNGVTCYIKHEMTAGDQATLEHFLMMIEQGKSDAGISVNFKLVEINLVKIVYPDGREVRPTPLMIRNLDILTIKVLEDAINERYTPFLARIGQLMAQTGIRTTGSGDSLEPNHRGKS